MGITARGDHLAARLIHGSDLNLKDEKYNSPPLGWAIHGWCNPPAGNYGRQIEVVAFLISAGAQVEPQWLESDKVRNDPAMLGSESLEGMIAHARVCRRASGDRDA